MARHECNKDAFGRRDWPTCTACNGRIHEPGCTTRKNKHRDCCKARHLMLLEQGHEFGLVDDAVSMLGSWFTGEKHDAAGRNGI